MKIFKVAVVMLIAICLLLIVAPTTPSRSLSSSVSDITFEVDIAGGDQGPELVRYYATPPLYYFFSGYESVFEYVSIVTAGPAGDDRTSFATIFWSPPQFPSTPAFTFNFIKADHTARSVSLSNPEYYFSATVTSTASNSVENVWNLNAMGVSFDLHRKSSLEINPQLAATKSISEVFWIQNSSEPITLTSFVEYVYFDDRGELQDYDGHDGAESLLLLNGRFLPPSEQERRMAKIYTCCSTAMSIEGGGQYATVTHTLTIDLQTASNSPLSEAHYIVGVQPASGSFSTTAELWALVEAQLARDARTLLGFKEAFLPLVAK